MGIKIVFLVAFAAAFAVVINGRDLPAQMTGGDVDKAFLHPYFPPYHGVFGGYNGVGGGFGGNGGGRAGRGADNSQNGGIAGTGAVGGLESGATVGGGDDAFGDDVENGAPEVGGGSLP